MFIVYLQMNLVFFPDIPSDKSLKVSMQVCQSIIRSYIGFSICNALQSLILGYFRRHRSYKVLILIESIIAWRNGFPMF